MRRADAGFGYGQLFAVILGFLLTSGLIFLFGVWVGRDMAERRLSQEERVIRIPLAAWTMTPTPVPTLPPAAPDQPTPTVAPDVVEEPEARVWTVQVNGSTNPQEAVSLTLELRAKGFEAYTVEKMRDGQQWYWVRVGRFDDRTQAKAKATELRRDAGQITAHVIQQ